MFQVPSEKFIEKFGGLKIKDGGGTGQWHDED